VGSIGENILACTSVSGTGTTLKVLDLFGSASCAFEDMVVVPAPVPRPRRPWKSPPKAVQKSFDVPPMKGTCVRRCSIRLFYVHYI
jgi:hypothetical protein